MPLPRMSLGLITVDTTAVSKTQERVMLRIQPGIVPFKQLPAIPASMSIMVNPARYPSTLGSGTRREAPKTRQDWLLAMPV